MAVYRLSGSGLKPGIMPYSCPTCSPADFLPGASRSKKGVVVVVVVVVSGGVLRKWQVKGRIKVKGRGAQDKKINRSTLHACS